jgi:nitrous oxidase accessory protein
LIGKSKRVLLSLALIPLVLATSSARSVSAVYSVQAGEKITPVLNQAAAGDTVWLEKGQHFENLVVDTPIVLTGEDYPHIRGGYKGIVVHVLASGVVIDGLFISEAGSRLIKDMACVLIESDSVTVSNNKIDESLHGVYVKGGTRAIIRNNRIEGRLDLIEADRGNGIHLWNSHHSQIEGNEIFNARDGIYFSFADSTIIRQNHIHHVRYGLHYMYSNYNVFEDNLFEENVAGAALMYSKDIVFYRNVFARCRGFRAYGILYQSMDDTRAEQNLVLDNSRGIFLNNSGTNVLMNNDVVDNDVAIQFNGGGDENVFVGNNFINNLSELLLDVGHAGIQWTDGGGGNYWSGYDGYDLDGDGIGDLPYTIQNVFHVMESSTPEVRYYLFSPAAEILEIAEKALPILERGRTRDTAPRIRPLANHAPWSRVQNKRHKKSPSAAGAYLVGSVAPLLLLLRMSRRRQGEVC